MRCCKIFINMFKAVKKSALFAYTIMNVNLEKRYVEQLIKALDGEV